MNSRTSKVFGEAASASVHATREDSDIVQVAVSFHTDDRKAIASTTVHMPSIEARKLAALLIAAADHYDAETERMRLAEGVA